MKDNVERFIEGHRDEMDVFEPRKKIWDTIDANLSKQKQRRHFTYYAAAACLLMIIGIALWLKPGRQDEAQPVVTIPTAPKVESTEVYYTSMIELKRNELNHYCKGQPELCDQFSKELDTLNLLYGQLKQEYVKSGDNEAVLNAMMQNLQAQLQVLSLQLQAIHRINESKQPQKLI